MLIQNDIVRSLRPNEGHDQGALVVKHSLPYVEYEILRQEVLEQRIYSKAMLHFSHIIEAYLGGLMQAGFVMTAFYEDRRPKKSNNPIQHFMPSHVIARLQKNYLRGSD
jgi:hypothetical protein